jgi:GDP-L-fucose synthase
VGVAESHYDRSVDGWAGLRVLVTGGSGFVGRAVLRVLAERGAGDVVAPRRADFDLTRAEDVEKMFAEVAPDVVFHLAARVGGIGANLVQPADLYLSNLLMGTHVIEGARRRGVDKTVIVGTICSYPKHTPVPFSEDDLWNGYPEETNAPYGLAKKALLVHAQANRSQYGQNVVYLLPTNLYGPGDKFHPSVSHVVPALIKKCVEARESGASSLEVWGTGRATREFLFVDDAARALVLAGERYDDGDPLNIGSGVEVTVADLAGRIASLVGFEGDIVWDTTKPDGQPRRLVDSSRAREAFGFEASTALDAGLRATISWYRAHRAEAEAVAAL